MRMGLRNTRDEKKVDGLWEVLVVILRCSMIQSLGKHEERDMLIPRDYGLILREGGCIHDLGCRDHKTVGVLRRREGG